MDYAIWKPEHDGHAPPNWRKGMSRNILSLTRDAWLVVSSYDKSWSKQHKYQVPAEALNSPNDDAKPYDWQVDAALHVIRQLPAEELAKHGITLAPEKDWATELWADLCTICGMTGFAKNIREGRIDDDDRAAIELLRTRFEQMIA